MKNLAFKFLLPPHAFRLPPFFLPFSHRPSSKAITLLK
jgi:hypothetical protein